MFNQITGTVGIYTGPSNQHVGLFFFTLLFTFQIFQFKTDDITDHVMDLANCIPKPSQIVFRSQNKVIFAKSGHSLCTHAKRKQSQKANIIAI